MEVKISRLLDKCLLTGEYIWNGRYKQLNTGGEWTEGVLEKCSITGMYIWAGEGPRLLGQVPRPMHLPTYYVRRAACKANPK